MSSPTRVRGFTLVELMIIVALLAIVASIAAPNFIQLIRNNQVQAQTDEIATFLQYARSQAVSRRMPYTIDLDNWTVHPGNDTTSDAERQLDINPDKANPVHNQGNNATLSFTGQGLAKASGTFKVVICHGTDKANGYLLEVRPSGLLKRYQRGKQDDTTSLTSCTSF